MGMIINIDKALEQRSEFNILKEPLHMMLKNQQEAWEKENPIDLLFVRGTLNGFQETYVSNIGFDHAFKETSDYSVGPIFNTAEGFAATYTSRTFQGSFIITQQVLEDSDARKVKDTATAFLKRWHGDTVDYAMKAVSAGFGVAKDYEGSTLLLKSADTSDGDIIANGTNQKNPLFYKNHMTVKRKDGAAPIAQSNMFAATLANHTAAISLTDPEAVSKMADLINYVITAMENYRDDNGKRAVVLGEKTIVAPNNARLKAILESAVAMDVFGGVPNPAYKRAVVKTNPYLNDMDCCIKSDGSVLGFFIVDKAYNAANHGLEFTERIPLTLDATWEKRPKGVIYDGRQRFDINVATWRGIAYVAIGISSTESDWNYYGKFTEYTPAVIAKVVKTIS